jgi:hypothetical protein
MVDTGPDPCLSLPTEPVASESVNIHTEEDFDFDFLGYVLFQQGTDLVGRTRYGDFLVVAPNVSEDMAGIEVLGNGDVVASDDNSGIIKRIDRTTGRSSVIKGGLSLPNGLEVGTGNIVFYTEWGGDRVGWVNAETLEGGVVTTAIKSPNGIVLSPDEQTLYVAGRSEGMSALIALDRLGGQTWSAPRPILASRQLFDGVESDVCGNLYTVEYSTGRVIRIDPLTGVAIVLADLEDPGFSEFSSLRWGNGVGGWDPSVLYVTDRNQLFEVHVGIEGALGPIDPP